MTDARIRFLPPLVLAMTGLSLAGCASQPTATATPPPPEPVASAPAEAPPADEPEGTETPPEELEAAAPQIEPLAPAVAYGDVLARIRGNLSLPQVSHPRVDREIQWL